VTDARHERLSAVFLQATEMDPGARGAFLDEACRDEPQMRARIENMLEHDEDAPGFRRTGISIDTADPADTPMPEWIGPYEILEEVGEGGMGVVYRAQQDEPIRRQVALKLIRVGIESTPVIARFESERQTLALMDHPTIARVLDAGTTDDGRPYFAMEFVEGRTITEYCDEHRLGLRDRLELFSRVCDGVQHAHQKAIIHRDLKPSNVMVITLDGNPVPKIIDFGIAKATAPQTSGVQPLTEAGYFFGTPEYMSPEQAEMGREDVDTRTDVYALGVLLYELLTRARPFEFRDKTFDEIRRAISEDDPRKPSERSDDPGAARRLRGDLDWITMKALAKDRARRYASPSELAADLARHLSDEPVLAGPPSGVYRLGKFVRKHRVAVGFAAALLVFLVGFGVTMALLAGRIANERDRANAEALRAQRQARTAMQVQEVLMRMLQLVDKNQSRGESWSVPEMLFWARNALEGILHDEPVVRARVMLLLGQIYENLGYEEGLELMRDSLTQLQEALARDPSPDVESLHVLAIRDTRLGHLQEAELLARYVVDARVRGLGDDHPETVNAKADLARVYFMSERIDEAGALLESTLATALDKLGQDHPYTLKTTGHLARVYIHMSRVDDAQQLLGPAIDRMRALLGHDHLVTLDALYDLARVAALNDEPTQAHRFLREAVDGGLTHQRTGADGRAVHGREAILLDPILFVLHGDPEFEAIVGSESWEAALQQAEQHVRNGDHPSAIHSLRLARERGCTVSRRIARNPRLLALHGEPEFDAIVAEMEASQ